MARKGFFRRLGSFFAPDDKPAPPQTAAEEAPIEQVAENVAPETPVEPPEAKSRDELLMDALDRQTARIEDLLGELRAMCDMNRTLVQSIQPAAEDRQRSEKSVGEMLTAAQEAAGELRRLVEATESHGRLLHKIQADLAADRDGDAQAGAAIARLADTLQSVRDSNASHIELMERVRDQLGGADEELHDAVASQGRRTTVLLIVVAVLLAAIAAMKVWECLWL